MSSEYFIVQSIVFLYFSFDWNFTLFPGLPRAATVLFCLVNMEPVPDMKIPSQSENQHLYTTATVVKYCAHEKEVAGHSNKYSRANTILEIEVESHG